jgi:hypothetical protein
LGVERKVGEYQDQRRGAKRNAGRARHAPHFTGRAKTS